MKISSLTFIFFAMSFAQPIFSQENFGSGKSEKKIQEQNVLEPEESIQLFGRTWKIPLSPTMLETPLVWQDVRDEVEKELKDLPENRPIESLLQDQARLAAKKYTASVKVLAESSGENEEELIALFQSGKGGRKWPKIQHIHNVMVGINHILDATYRHTLSLVKTDNKKVNPTPGSTKRPALPERTPIPPKPRALDWDQK